MSFLLTLSWPGRHEPSSRAQFSSEWSLDHLETPYRISTIDESPFCSYTFPRAFPSRRNRTIEGWGSRSTVNARSRRHRFGNWISSGFPNSCRVPLSNGSDPTEPVHLDQFYFRPRNGGELSNELKKSQRGTKNTPPRKIFL